MELALLVYGIESIDGVLTLIKIGILLCVLAIITAFASTENKASDVKNFRIIKWSVSVAIVFSIIYAAIPTKKTAYTMVAAYAAQSIYTNPKVEQMSGKVLKIIDQKLEEYIADGEKEMVQTIAEARSSASQSK